MSDSARYALHRPELLGALIRGEEKIKALLTGSDWHLAAGQALVDAGTDHPFVYRLREGWVGRARTLTDGRRQFILIFLPGDLFAVKSMFLNRHIDAIVSLSDSVVERIDYRTLYAAYVKDGDIASRCIWQVIEEERRLHSWVTGLGQGSAEERLAMLLLDFRGRLVLSGTIAADALSYPMPLTQSQLSDHLGITAVHVNRTLKGYRESGIVTVKDGQVLIGNLKKLIALAAPLLDAYEKVTPAYGGSKISDPHGRNV